MLVWIGVGVLALVGVVGASSLSTVGSTRHAAVAVALLPASFAACVMLQQLLVGGHEWILEQHQAIPLPKVVLQSIHPLSRIGSVTLYDWLLMLLTFLVAYGFAVFQKHLVTTVRLLKFAYNQAMHEASGGQDVIATAS